MIKRIYEMHEQMNKHYFIISIREKDSKII